ncbi:putative transcriptional regulator, MerR family protein [Streptomyces bingchenggensis BCW-1]|uniref:Putative transcriptional regulator, MerR family protein n=1 Tax=Streptomyces bingchenggensis (strain BCW-1) TaxID=749414 RepID=D7CEA9_STRBB|nr:MULTISPECIES: MerR family transcriptional regulator [Streptomyces]ADI06796.1 putative transcriptional regulator, MerR family protein [Streptomyces bingchenggensis BCW-1]
MDGGALYSIGQLARRTGLTVKTIRFYSDRGIVAPTDRSPAGYRLYGVDAVARLELVRTLRELGLDLATVRKVVDRELSLAEVAAAHAEALTVQIRTLRLRRAVLTAVAERGASPEEMEIMHTLARLSEDERRNLIGEFLDAVFGGLDGNPEFAAVRRSMTPELPESPEAEQVRAWVELAELSRDPEFRARVRRVAEEHSAERNGVGPCRDVVAVVRDWVGPVVAAGVEPALRQADPVVEGVVGHYARLVGQPDGAALRRRLLARLESVNDPRRERYVRLLARVNGWPAPDSLTPVLEWAVAALRARTSDSRAAASMS